jgi:hypothetical protein
MARYKDVDSGMKLLAGTFEHALSQLMDRELNLSHFRCALSQ